MLTIHQYQQNKQPTSHHSKYSPLITLNIWLPNIFPDNEHIYIYIYIYIYTVKPVLRGHLWDKENMTLQVRWPLKRGSIHMKFSMTGQEKYDISIQVTA